MRHIRALTLCASALMLPAAVSAQTFDFDASAPGLYSSLTAVNGAQTLTVTTNTAGTFSVISGAPPGMGLQSLLATAVGDGRPAFRFSFAAPVSFASFLVGDFGLDDDSPISVQAFNSLNQLLGTFSTAYPSSSSSGMLLNAAIGAPGGASYFVGTGGGPFSNSLYWEVANSTIAGPVSIVPEPSTYALMASGLAGLLLVARRRRI